MKFNVKSLITAGAFAMLATVFAACGSTTEESRGFADWDGDKDGMLTSDEYGSAWGDSEYYSRWDTNNDSFLDENEWTTGRDRDLGDYEGTFGDWDGDADGRLNEDEFRGGIFGHYDRDRDSNLNEEEYNGWYGSIRD